MKFQLKELTDTKCSFVIEGVRPDIVNALRRTLLVNVPKMAIDEVEFHMGPIRDEEGNEYDSNSALFDEMIAHRLALVPIPTDLDNFTFRDQCECEGSGCPHCTIIYVLNKKGPCTAYSGDLQPLGDTTLRVKEELIPILKLKEKQALLIYATAILGRGNEHAKFQPVTVCGYNYYPKYYLSSKEHKEPELNFGIWDGEKKSWLIKDLIKDDLCKRCRDTCNANGVMEEPPFETTGRDDKFLFTFETDGSITAKDSLKYALNHLALSFDEIREGVSGLDV